MTGRPLNARERADWMTVWQGRGPDSFEFRPKPTPAAEPFPAGEDRAYQKAALLFRGERYDEAAQAFRALAANAQYPYHDWAAYLVGRSLLWHARTAMRDQDYDRRLQQAQAAFERVVRDPAMGRVHDPAERLLIRCLLITNPRQALERLGRRLLTSSRLGMRTSDLGYYLNGYDNDPRPEDPLSLWLRAYQSGHLPSLERGWRETSSRAWLLALLQHTRAFEPRRVEAALATPVEAPGGPALYFEAARLLAQHGDFAKAREVSDAAAAQLAGLPSARNQVESLRMQLAETLEEFARRLPRRVVMLSWEMDESEWRSDKEPGPPRLDVAAVQHLQTSVPLRRWEEVMALLPAHLQSELRTAYDARRALLDGGGRDWAVKVLATPGTRPYPSVGVGRGMKATESDGLRASFWQLDARGLGADNDLPYWSQPQLPDLVLDRVPFVSEAERAEAREECARLRSFAPNGYEFVARQVLDAVNADPRHPEAPRRLLKILENSAVSWFSRVPRAPITGEVLRTLKRRYPRSPEATSLGDLEMLIH
jgi:hypothetical protein